MRQWMLLCTVGLMLLGACGGGAPAAVPAAKTETAAPRQAGPEADLPPPGEPEVGAAPAVPVTQVSEPPSVRVESWVVGLEVPWDLAFLTAERALVTERPGRVRLVENGSLRSQVYAELPVASTGEGGLMGIAAHPSYPEPSHVFVMYTYRSSGGVANRISRLTDTGAGLTGEKVLVEGIPGRRFHNGGALAFGPDGLLYAGTGDAGEPELAQDLDSLAGKILRLRPDGTVPEDNPFPGSLVWAYGLRNVQGLAWHPGTGELWATMHGPSGDLGLRAKDEVFVVQRGGNHGWPRVLGLTGRRGVVEPVLFFPDVAVPPAGAAFAQLGGGGVDFFFASLRGEHLARVLLEEARPQRLEQWFATGEHEGRFGRLRAVVTGPDGALYVTTSNRDGRGRQRPGDDRVLRITAGPPAGESPEGT